MTFKHYMIYYVLFSEKSSVENREMKLSGYDYLQMEGRVKKFLLNFACSIKMQNTQIKLSKCMLEFYFTG